MLKPYRCLSLLAVLTLALGATSAAFAAPPTIVGSWETTVTLVGAPSPDVILETYHEDGTLVASGPSAGSATISHGAWKKTGGKTFSATIVILLYDASGDLESRLRGELEGEVAQGGESYAGVIASQLELPDGTVVASFTGTVSGQRISASP